MNRELYVRTLKRVDNGKFCVGETGKENKKEQKNYYHPTFNVVIPYASGQQIKRCIKEASNLERVSKVFTYYPDNKNVLNELEVFNKTNDPRCIENLFFGYGIRPDKRMSPNLISRFTPLHPLLATFRKDKMNVVDETNASSIHEYVIVESKVDNTKVSKEKETEIFSNEKNKNRKDTGKLFRKLVGEDDIVDGFFKNDIVINLERLCVIYKNELSSDVKKEDNKTNKEIYLELQNDGWIPVKSRFLDEGLLMPKELRDAKIRELAHGIIYWQINTNQSLHYDPMLTLAIAIGFHPNVFHSISSKLIEYDVNDVNKSKSIPIIYDDFEDVDLFKTRSVESYLKNQTGTATALTDAENKLTELIIQGVDSIYKK